MRIGFDVSQTGAGRAGCGWYARSLIENLESCDRNNSYVIYPTFGDHFWSPAAGGDTYRPRARNFTRGLRHRSLSAMQEFWSAPPADWITRLGSPQVIHSNNFYCPVGTERPRVVYTLYDLGFLHQPDWSTEANRSACFRGVYDASLSADFIVAISDFSRQDFLSSFPYFPAERIAVVSPASRFIRNTGQPRPPAKPNLKPGAFWLHVGNDEPRKNRDRLLSAYAELQSDHSDAIPLVMAGGEGWLTGDLHQRFESLGIANQVHHLGYVEDDVLQWLYENCFGFVFPSCFEGFGMPVLEAMELGAPVIASNTTSIPEITANAAILMDPMDPRAITEAMRGLLEHPQRRAELRDEGFRRAALFSWTEAARRVMAVYRDVVGRPPRRKS